MNENGVWNELRAQFPDLTKPVVKKVKRDFDEHMEAAVIQFFPDRKDYNWDLDFLRKQIPDMPWR
jgi:hypothetical protein